MDQQQQAIRFPFSSALLTIALAAAISVVAAWQILPAVGAEAQVAPALTAFAVCGGFGLLALFPVFWLDRRKAGGAAYGFMIGMLLRLVGCSAVYFLLDAGLDRTFAYWMAGAYLLLLIVELIVVGRYVRRLQTPAASAPSVPVVESHA